MEKAPNILLITADQWRADYFGYLGAEFARTPNIDALAESSSCFLNHYTNAVPCGPSRATLLTGLYPMLHRSIVNGTPLDRNIPTLPILAREAGYDPVLFGYTDTSADPRGLSPDDPRLKTYEGVMDGFRTGLNLNLEATGSWQALLSDEGLDAEIWERGPGGDGRAFDTRQARYTDEQSNTRFLADHVINEIESSDQPFFIHASFLRPHPPLQAPEPWHEIISPDSVPKPIKRQEDTGSHPIQAVFDEMMAMPSYFDPSMDLPAMTEEDTANARAVYAGLCSEVDLHLGRIFDALKDSGQYDNTLIVFTSDHGEMLGDHGCWGKLHWYDSCWHIPLIIKLPHQSEGKKIEAFTEAVDIMPSLLDFMAQKIPANVHGHSLIPFASGKEVALETWRNSVLLEADFRDPVDGFVESRLGLDPEHCSCAILRDHDFKYVHFTDLPPVLYDLRKDPQETTNVADRPEYQSVMLSMARRLLSARMAASDRTFTNVCLTENGVLDNTDLRPCFRPLSSE